jgi:hypothetical protein
MCGKAAIILRACAALAVIGFVQDARADFCANGLTPELHQRVTLLKRTGDCDLVPGVMAASDQAFAYGVSHCPDWHRTKSRAQVEREMRRFCRTKPQTRIATSQPSMPATTAPATQPAVPPTNSTPKSSSCSDITGTKDTTPAANDCKDAGSSLRAARVTREKYPAVSSDEYKKAAAAARRAGDRDLELSILREAAAPADPANQPAQNPDNVANVSEANTYLTAAKAAEANDPTCDGLARAAENYLQAAKLFLRADEIKKTNESLQRHDALNELVDRAKQEGRCHAPVREASSPPPNSGKLGDDRPAEECKQKLADIDKLLARPGSNMNSIGDEPASGDKAKPAPNIASIAIVAKVKLAAQGCRDPDAGPFSELECRVASYDMRTQGIVGAEADAILEKANCR